ncbi:MAG: hypothetical protein R3Y56_08480 [Akkermansia sp.]
MSESRMQKLFDNCAPVKALYPPDKNKKRNTTIHFANGMTLWMAGAYNRKNLQTRSIRWLIGDETWLWPQGHMAEAEARVTAFGWQIATKQSAPLPMGYFPWGIPTLVGTRGAASRAALYSR